MTIEAKVDEGFDKTVGEWLGDGSGGKVARLAKLCAIFRLDPGSVTHFRYKLFHRTASALIEAKRYRASQAAMIVQSWSKGSCGFDDYALFFGALGLDVGIGKISDAVIISGVMLRTAWSAEM